MAGMSWNGLNRTSADWQICTIGRGFLVVVCHPVLALPVRDIVAKHYSIVMFTVLEAQLGTTGALTYQCFGADGIDLMNRSICSHVLEISMMLMNLHSFFPRNSTRNRKLCIGTYCKILSAHNSPYSDSTSLFDHSYEYHHVR